MMIMVCAGLGLFLVSSAGWTATYDVGGGNNDYPTMSALTGAVTLTAGDVVNIYPGRYTDAWQLNTANASASNPITIRGVDSAGAPVTYANGPVIFDYSGLTQVPNGTGKAAILLLSGSWIVLQGFTVSNIPFLNTDYPAMKIKADYVTLRHLYFLNNYFSVGAWPESAKLTIEHSEFEGGHGALGGYNMHAVYSFGDHLIVRHSSFRNFDSPAGDVIKSRDFIAEILYNFIEMGTAQRGVDIDTLERSPGSISPDATIIGNTLIKKTPDQSAYTANFINYDRQGRATIINNTMVDLINQVQGAISLRDATSNEVSNNAMVTQRVRFVDGGLPSNVVFSGRNNWISQGAVVDGGVQLVGTVTGTNPGFLADGTYRPALGSPLIDAGYPLVSIKPDFQFPALVRTITGAGIDIGAYEYGFGSSDTTPPLPPSNVDAFIN
ncbi:MAG: choice-of-anchor Q domain-containing protein [Nitrospirota bacterium]